MVRLDGDSFSYNCVTGFGETKEQKAVLTRIIGFLSSTIFFYCHQYGFRESLGVIDATFDIVSRLQNALDEGYLAAGLFVDIRKAFDSVDIKLLLKKLKIAGFKGLVLKWFESYLNDTSVSR